jgi:methylated-DNA-[protein]-cysteine S-methyltransferase
MAVVRLSGLPAEAGDLDAHIADGHLVALRFAMPGSGVATPTPAAAGAPDAGAARALADILTRELAAWFAGECHTLTLPVASPPTSAFRRRVYEQLGAVPAGSTVTYGELAARAGAPGAARAVGTAMATNPLPFFVPCHRVVPATGGIGAYGGGREVKSWLLGLEAERRSVTQAP